MPKTLYVFVIFLCSGIAGLMYEVLWMKQLSLLFGNTAQSTAATTSAFFLGIAAGSYVWGRRQRRAFYPLRTYARLEFGIMAAAMMYFLILSAWSFLYPFMYDLFGHSPALMTTLKLLLAAVLICPAAFLMGGTLPVMGQYLIREASQLGRWSGWLYGINTFGAALGALLAGLFLPRWLGFNNTYTLALSLTFAVACVAYLLSRNEPPQPAAAEPAAATAPQLRLLTGLALLSGFATMALQVLWTRMFAQVLQNSVYTFALILTVFLLALSLGALLSRGLAQIPGRHSGILLALLCLSGLAVCVVPLGFTAWTDGLRYLGDDVELARYLLQTFLAAALLIGLPTLVMGILLPYLYKLADGSAERPGALIGRLNGWNTLGAVAGSLCAGFLLLEWLGLWRSILLMGALYLLAAVALVVSRRPGRLPLSLLSAPLGILVLAFTLLDVSRLPNVRIQADSEVLLESWEGSGGTVAVVERDGDLRIKLNNWYALGATSALQWEQLQSHLPLHLHPDPKRVFYLGLGTGITAGAAMRYPVEKVVIAELVSEVVTAAEKYFAPYTQGLFNDPRVRIVHEDGRNYLRGTSESYDLIIADLFVPWKAGVGYLYTREHFAAAKLRLRAGGMFVQWVPLYQTGEREFGIIARTMLAEFPQVTMWRGDFFADRPVVALVGHLQPEPLSADTLMVRASRVALAAYRRQASDQMPLLAHYLGNLEPHHPLVAESPIATDDHPWIEYLAPAAHRSERAGTTTWFVGAGLARFMQGLQNNPANSVYLSRLDAELRRVVPAGLFYHLAAIAKARNQTAAFEQALQRGESILSGASR